MTMRFPYALSGLGTGGAIPANGRPVRAEFFNRVFRSVVALQAAIGKDIEGSKTDLKTRLAVEMLGDGHFERSVLCEDDPSGNQAGTRRYWDSQQQNVNVGTTGKTFALNIGFTLFEEPPVCMACCHQTQAQGYNTDQSRRLLVDIAPENVRLFFSQIDGTGPASGVTRAVAWLTVSQNLHVYENDKTWVLPPTRTGS